MAEVPAEPEAPGWLAAGPYVVRVLVRVGGDARPREWIPAVEVPAAEGRAARRRELEVQIAEEPHRPLAGAREAA
jgi:hypothetical protein